MTRPDPGLDQGRERFLSIGLTVLVFVVLALIVKGVERFER